MQIVIMPCGGGGFVHRGGLNGIDDSSNTLMNVTPMKSPEIIFISRVVRRPSEFCDSISQLSNLCAFYSYFGEIPTWAEREKKTQFSDLYPL